MYRQRRYGHAKRGNDVLGGYFSAVVEIDPAAYFQRSVEKRIVNRAAVHFAVQPRGVCAADLSALDFKSRRIGVRRRDCKAVGLIDRKGDESAGIGQKIFAALFQLGKGVKRRFLETVRRQKLFSQITHLKRRVSVLQKIFKFSVHKFTFFEEISFLKKFNIRLCKKSSKARIDV